MKRWAHILLGIWLMLMGLEALGAFRLSGSATVLSILAVFTGILFLLIDRSEKTLPKLGSVLLGLWLLATGLFPLLHVHFSGSGVVLAVLAVVAGALKLVWH